ncbi:MAG TPA: tetratricopeptide repeat protein, partial [Prolixibacteraceae bacterium]|nr:tetratricopeptide repeat protein [Prolixibacteraceae bacterium]
MRSCHMSEYLIAGFLFAASSVYARSSPIDSLKNLLEGDLSDSTRMEIYNEIGEISFRNNYDESLEYSQKALQIAEKNGYIERVIEFRKNVGDTYRNMGDYRLAEQYFSKNLEDAKNGHDTLVLRGAFQNLGGVYINLARFDTAIYFLTEAANLAKATNDKAGVAGIYANIGLALVSNNETEKALGYLQQSLKMYEELGNTVQIAGGNLRIARVYLNLKDNETALKYGLLALENARKAGHKAMLATAYSEVSTTYLNLGRLDEAMELTKKSLAIKMDMGNKRGIASCLYTLGSIHNEKGEFRPAEKYLLEALDLFKTMGAREQVMEACKALSGLYRKTGQYENAWLFLQNYSSLRDTILNEQNLKQIASLETQFRVKEKERELEIQKMKISNQENALRKQKIMLLGGLLIIALTIILLFLLYRNLKQRKKMNSQLKELDEAKSRFFANISHELRTPLTLILAPLQNLTRRCRDQSSLFELKLIGSNAKNLLQLTDEVLELSKLESGTIRLNKSTVKINEWCRRIFFTYQSLAQFRKIELTFHSGIEEETALVLDIKKTEKILNNLIMNAFKYSFSEGSILFTLKHSGNELHFSVKDSGQGIHPDDRPNIFNRYFQSGQKGQSEKGG